MADSHQRFVTWYFNVFSQTQLFADMTACVEGSKWHREANVGVHTNMVVGEYLARAKSSWTKEDLLGALACAFHDTGKPVARTEKFSEERGVYFGFGGHEIASARLWEDWVSTNWTEFSTLFDLSVDDIYRVSWMIEHHRPWGLKHKEKRRNLYLTAYHVCGTIPFLRMLRADNWGRIGDTQEENQKQVKDWIDDFIELVHEVDVDAWYAPFDCLPHLSHNKDAPVMYMAIGVSGTGKSTFLKTLQDAKEVLHYSWDSLRMQFYETDDYPAAFAASCDDKTFGSRVNEVFMEDVATKKDIYVDNVNLSAKRRRFFLDQARRKGYHCVAVVAPVPLKTVIARQDTRTDKHINHDIVARQYSQLQQPQFGEFDEIVVRPSNLL